MFVLDSNVWSHWTDMVQLLTKIGTLKAGTTIGGINGLSLVTLNFQ